MGFFEKRELRKKEKQDAKIRAALLPTLHGKVIKYTSERDPETNTDIILGKEGSMTIRAGELIVLSSSQIVFRADINTVNVSELLSGDGVILEGEDLERDGKHRKIIAYYLYYR